MNIFCLMLIAVVNKLLISFIQFLTFVKHFFMSGFSLTCCNYCLFYNNHWLIIWYTKALKDNDMLFSSDLCIFLIFFVNSAFTHFVTLNEIYVHLCAQRIFVEYNASNLGPTPVTSVYFIWCCTWVDCVLYLWCQTCYAQCRV